MPKGNHYGEPKPEQREEFLAHIADGKTRQEAADLVGSSASRFKGLYARDEEFAQRYLEALRQAGREPSALTLEIQDAEGLQLAHRLFDEYILRALDSERGSNGSSNRVLRDLAMLKLEDFKPLLEARVRHDHAGAIGIYQVPQLDMDKWTLAEHEEWVALEERRNELIARARPDNEKISVQKRELIAARVIEADAETIDGEAVEVAS